MIRGAVIGASALALIATAAPAQAVPAAATAPTAPYSALVLDGHQGSYMLNGAVSFDPSNATVTGSTSSGVFSLSASNPTVGYSTSASPPAGSAWAAGTTYPIAAIADSTHASFSIWGNGRSCTTNAPGTLTVAEATTDSSNNVTAFAATFTAACDNVTPAITGEIRWNSSIGYTGAVMDQYNLAYGRQSVNTPGPAQTVTFTATGSSPVVYGKATLAGTNPDSFVITRDTCSSGTFAYGQTCTVSVAADAMSSGPQNAFLSLPDNTASGQKYVAVAVDAYIGSVGTYYPVSPARILDTRTGLGASKGAVGAGGTVHLQVLGRGGVPASGVGAVVLNVTVTAPSAASYLTVYPDGGTRPTASSLNFPAGWTGANSVNATVGSDGMVAIYNAAGSTQVIADVVGYYGGSDSLVTSGPGVGGQFQPVQPQRILDTRANGGAKLKGGWFIDIPVDYGTTYNAHIRALVVNVTAVQPDSTGYLATFDGQQANVPSTSTLDYTAGRIVPNLAVVPTSVCTSCGSTSLPMIGVYTSASTHVLVDIVGVYDDGTLPDGLRYNPISPTRIVDSRTGLGTPSAIGPNSTATITTPDSVLAVPNTWALALNVTAISPSLNTYLTVWPDGISGLAQPAVSNLNPAQGQTIPNAVDTLIGPKVGFDIYNARGTVNVVVDVVGTFYLYPGTASSNSQALSARKAGHASTLHANLPPAIVHSAG